MSTSTASRVVRPGPSKGHPSTGPECTDPGRIFRRPHRPRPPYKGHQRNLGPNRDGTLSPKHASTSTSSPRTRTLRSSRARPADLPTLGGQDRPGGRPQAAQKQPQLARNFPDCPLPRRAAQDLYSPTALSDEGCSSTWALWPSKHRSWIGSWALASSGGWERHVRVLSAVTGI